MARIRSIKPEFWVSEQIAECSTNARLTFIGLWTFSDDQGVHPARPKTLKAELFPMDDVSASDVSGWVDELVRVGLVVVFDVDGDLYWHVTGWAKHQRIEHPSAKYPAPPKFSPNVRRTLDDLSTKTREDSSKARSGVERSGEEGKGEAPSPKARRSRASAKRPETTMPEGFEISERVATWARKNGHGNLSRHLECFCGKALAKGYSYVDWDEAFMNAIRDDWAGMRSGAASSRPVLHANNPL